MGPRVIRKLKVNLSLEQEVLPGGHWHWSPCPGTASLSRNGCGPQSSWLHFRCAKGTLLQILRARNRTDRTFQKREFSTGMCKLSFGEPFEIKGVIPSSLLSVAFGCMLEGFIS